MSTVQSMGLTNSSRPILSEPLRCLQETLRYWRSSRIQAAATIFRFLHVSTDEVYGTLGADGLFTEDSLICAELTLLRKQGVV